MTVQNDGQITLPLTSIPRLLRKKTFTMRSFGASFESEIETK